MLRQFAQSNALEIFVVNIDAFNKAVNIINRSDNDNLIDASPLSSFSKRSPS